MVLNILMFQQRTKDLIFSNMLFLVTNVKLFNQKSNINLNKQFFLSMLKIKICVLFWNLLNKIKIIFN